MADIKIHVLHTGKVCVTPELPFGGKCGMLKASGLFSDKSKRIWLPVSVYLIESMHGKILFDCGWHRNVSPNGIYDKKAQIKSFGSFLLYAVNQGIVENSMTVDEQLAGMGIKSSDIFCFY